MKNKIVWNKGRKLSEQHKKNLSKAHLGHIPWNKGKSWSSEMKEKLSNSHKNKGIIHRNLDRSLANTLRGTAAYRSWRKKVLENNDNRCLWCGNSDRIEADHIISVSTILEQKNIKAVDE